MPPEYFCSGAGSLGTPSCSSVVRSCTPLGVKDERDPTRRKQGRRASSSVRPVIRLATATGVAGGRRPSHASRGGQSLRNSTSRYRRDGSGTQGGPRSEERRVGK